jgi:hypothetical protein
LTKKIDELSAQAQNELERLVQSQKQRLAEKQEVQKKVLNFLHEIGFDRIPQTILEIIIENINKNQKIRDQN